MDTLKDNDILRKYMSLSKLIFLLQNKRLFFCRADLLMNFKESWFIRSNNEYCFFYGDKNVIQEDFQNLNTSYLRNTNEIAKYIFISSWNYGNSESQSLWKCFGLKNECVILETNVTKFKKSFISELVISPKKVEYLNIEPWSIMYIPNSNFITPFYLNDISSAFESECRVILSTFEDSIPNSVIEPVYGNADNIIGLYLPIDLSILIEKIIIFPDAEEFIFDAIKSSIYKYMPDCKIVSSTLNKAGVKE